MCRQLDFLSLCVLVCARWRWWVGAKMQGSSNVNYSGLGHLLRNSKMSQRCMPCWCVVVCGKEKKNKDNMYLHVFAMQKCFFKYNYLSMYTFTATHPMWVITTLCIL